MIQARRIEKFLSGGFSQGRGPLVENLYERFPELVKAIGPVFGDGRGKFQSEGMDSSFHSGIISQGSGENPVTAEWKMILSTGFLEPFNKIIQIGGWAVVIVPPQRRVNADDLDRPEPMKKGDLKFGFFFAAGPGTGIISPLCPIPPVFSREIAVDIYASGVGSRLRVGEKSIGIDEGGYHNVVVFGDFRVGFQMLGQLEGNIDRRAFIPVDSPQEYGRVGRVIAEMCEKEGSFQNAGPVIFPDDFLGSQVVPAQIDKLFFQILQETLKFRGPAVMGDQERGEKNNRQEYREREFFIQRIAFQIRLGADRRLFWILSYQIFPILWGDPQLLENFGVGRWRQRAHVRKPGE